MTNPIGAMTNPITAAEEFVRVAQEDGYSNMQPAEYDDLVDALKNLAPQDGRIGNGGVTTCPRCGQCETMPLPITVDAMCFWIRYFAEKHRWCKA